ncbi:MAG: hypothetical protein QXM31_02520, partial [Candidatus Woesearchaeota archaeon]
MADEEAPIAAREAAMNVLADRGALDPEDLDTIARVDPVLQQAAQQKLLEMPPLVAKIPYGTKSTMSMLRLDDGKARAGLMGITAWQVLPVEEQSKLINSITPAYTGPGLGSSFAVMPGPIRSSESITQSQEPMTGEEAVDEISTALGISAIPPGTPTSELPANVEAAITESRNIGTLRFFFPKESPKPMPPLSDEERAAVEGFNEAFASGTMLSRYMVPAEEMTREERACKEHVQGLEHKNPSIDVVSEFVTCARDAYKDLTDRYQAELRGEQVMAPSNSILPPGGIKIVMVNDDFVKQFGASPDFVIGPSAYIEGVPAMIPGFSPGTEIDLGSIRTAQTGHVILFVTETPEAPAPAEVTEIPPGPEAPGGRPAGPLEQPDTPTTIDHWDPVLNGPVSELDAPTSDAAPVPSLGDQCETVNNPEEGMQVIPGGEISRSMIPYGYEVIANFSTACLNGSTIDLSINIPDNFEDIRAFLMTPDGASEVPAGVSPESLCGGMSTQDVRGQQISQARADSYSVEEMPAIVQQQARLKLGETAILQDSGYAVEIINAETPVSVKMSMPRKDVPYPTNPSARIVGTPLLITFDSRISGKVRITFPNAVPEFVDPSSLRIAALVGGSWRTIDDIAVEGASITATLSDIMPFLAQGEDGYEVIVALIGVHCMNCITAALDKVYDGMGSREAVVLVHGITTDSLRWQFLIDDFVQTKAPIQVWTFSYPLSMQPDKAAAELSSLLEQHASEFDRVHFITHSMGGIEVQLALNNARQKGFSYLRKVGSVVLAGQPGLGSPTAGVYSRLFAFLLNVKSAAMLFSMDSPMLMQAVEGRQVERVPGIQYFVLAGRQPYKFTMSLFRYNNTYLPNDGIITTASARTVGGREIANMCIDYFEAPLTHTDLVDSQIARRVMERLVLRDIARNNPDIAIAGYNKFVNIAAACKPGTYVVVGKRISEDAAADPLNCNCGNGVCGEGEDETNCPSDCAVRIGAFYLCRISPWLLYPAMFALLGAVSAYAYFAIIRHRLIRGSNVLVVAVSVVGAAFVAHHIICGMPPMIGYVIFAFTAALLAFVEIHLRQGWAGVKPFAVVVLIALAGLAVLSSPASQEITGFATSPGIDEITGAATSLPEMLISRQTASLAGPEGITEPAAPSEGYAGAQMPSSGTGSRTMKGVIDYVDHYNLDPLPIESLKVVISGFEYDKNSATVRIKNVGTGMYVFSNEVLRVKAGGNFWLDNIPYGYWLNPGEEGVFVFTKLGSASAETTPPSAYFETSEQQPLTERPSTYVFVSPLNIEYGDLMLITEVLLLGPGTGTPEIPGSGGSASDRPVLDYILMEAPQAELDLVRLGGGIRYDTIPGVLPDGGTPQVSQFDERYQDFEQTVIEKSAGPPVMQVSALAEAPTAEEAPFVEQPAAYPISDEGTRVGRMPALPATGLPGISEVSRTFAAERRLSALHEEAASALERYAAMVERDPAELILVAENESRSTALMPIVPRNSDTAVLYEPMPNAFLSGDLVRIEALPSGNFLLVTCDGTGQGATAAGLKAIVNDLVNKLGMGQIVDVESGSIVENITLATQMLEQPELLMGYIDAITLSLFSPGANAQILAAVYYPSNGNVTFAGTGLALFVVRGNNSIERFVLPEFETGPMPRKANFTRLGIADVLVMPSYGVQEQLNNTLAQFIEALEFNATLRSLRTVPAKAGVISLRLALESHRDKNTMLEKAQEDDYSAIILKFSQEIPGVPSARPPSYVGEERPPAEEIPGMPGEEIPPWEELPPGAEVPPVPGLPQEEGPVPTGAVPPIFQPPETGLFSRTWNRFDYDETSENKGQAAGSAETGAAPSAEEPAQTTGTQISAVQSQGTWYTPFTGGAITGMVVGGPEAPAGGASIAITPLTPTVQQLMDNRIPSGYGAADEAIAIQNLIDIAGTPEDSASFQKTDLAVQARSDLAAKLRTMDDADADMAAIRNSQPRIPEPGLPSRMAGIFISAASSAPAGVNLKNLMSATYNKALNDKISKIRAAHTRPPPMGSGTGHDEYSENPGVAGHLSGATPGGLPAKERQVQPAQASEIAAGIAQAEGQGLPVETRPSIRVPGTGGFSLEQEISNLRAAGANEDADALQASLDAIRFGTTSSFPAFSYNPPAYTASGSSQVSMGSGAGYPTIVYQQPQMQPGQTTVMIPKTGSPAGMITGMAAYSPELSIVASSGASGSLQQQVVSSAGESAYLIQKTRTGTSYMPTSLPLSDEEAGQNVDLDISLADAFGQVVPMELTQLQSQLAKLYAIEKGQPWPEDADISKLEAAFNGLDPALQSSILAKLQGMDMPGGMPTCLKGGGGAWTKAELDAIKKLPYGVPLITRPKPGERPQTPPDAVADAYGAFAQYMAERTGDIRNGFASSQSLDGTIASICKSSPDSPLCALDTSRLKQIGNDIKALGLDMIEFQDYFGSLVQANQGSKVGKNLLSLYMNRDELEKMPSEKYENKFLELSDKVADSREFERLKGAYEQAKDKFELGEITAKELNDIKKQFQDMDATVKRKWGSRTKMNSGFPPVNNEDWKKAGEKQSKKADELEKMVAANEKDANENPPNDPNPNTPQNEAADAINQKIQNAKNQVQNAQKLSKQAKMGTAGAVMEMAAAIAAAMQEKMDAKLLKQCNEYNKKAKEFNDEIAAWTDMWCITRDYLACPLGGGGGGGPTGGIVADLLGRGISQVTGLAYNQPVPDEAGACAKPLIENKVSNGAASRAFNLITGFVAGDYIAGFGADKFFQYCEVTGEQIECEPDAFGMGDEVQNVCKDPETCSKDCGAPTTKANTGHMAGIIDVPGCWVFDSPACLVMPPFFEDNEVAKLKDQLDKLKKAAENSFDSAVTGLGEKNPQWDVKTEYEYDEEGNVISRTLVPVRVPPEPPAKLPQTIKDQIRRERNGATQRAEVENGIVEKVKKALKGADAKRIEDVINEIEKILKELPMDDLKAQVEASINDVKNNIQAAKDFFLMTKMGIMRDEFGNLVDNNGMAVELFDTNGDGIPDTVQRKDAKNRIGDMPQPPAEPRRKPGETNAQFTKRYEEFMQKFSQWQQDVAVWTQNFNEIRRTDPFSYNELLPSVVDQFRNLEQLQANAISNVYAAFEEGFRAIGGAKVESLRKAFNEQTGGRFDFRFRGVDPRTGMPVLDISSYDENGKLNGKVIVNSNRLSPEEYARALRETGVKMYPGAPTFDVVTIEGDTLSLSEDDVRKMLADVNFRTGAYQLRKDAEGNFIRDKNGNVLIDATVMIDPITGRPTIVKVPENVRTGRIQAGVLAAMYGNGEINDEQFRANLLNTLKVMNPDIDQATLDSIDDNLEGLAGTDLLREAERIADAQAEANIRYTPVKLETEDSLAAYQQAVIARQKIGEQLGIVLAKAGVSAAEFNALGRQDQMLTMQRLMSSTAISPQEKFEVQLLYNRMADLEARAKTTDAFDHLQLDERDAVVEDLKQRAMAREKLTDAEYEAVRQDFYKRLEEEFLITQVGSLFGTANQKIDTVVALYAEEAEGLGIEFNPEEWAYSKKAQVAGFDRMEALARSKKALEDYAVYTLGRRSEAAYQASLAIERETDPAEQQRLIKQYQYELGGNANDLAAFNAYIAHREAAIAANLDATYDSSVVRRLERQAENADASYDYGVRMADLNSKKSELVDLISRVEKEYADKAVRSADAELRLKQYRNELNMVEYESAMLNADMAARILFDKLETTSIMIDEAAAKETIAAYRGLIDKRKALMEELALTTTQAGKDLIMQELAALDNELYVKMDEVKAIAPEIAEVMDRAIETRAKAMAVVDGMINTLEKVRAYQENFENQIRSNQQRLEGVTLDELTKISDEVIAARKKGLTMLPLELQTKVSRSAKALQDFISEINGLYAQRNNLRAMGGDTSDLDRQIESMYDIAGGRSRVKRMIDTLLNTDPGWTGVPLGSLGEQLVQNDKRTILADLKFELRGMEKQLEAYDQEIARLETEGLDVPGIAAEYNEAILRREALAERIKAKKVTSDIIEADTKNEIEQVAKDLEAKKLMLAQVETELSTAYKYKFENRIRVLEDTRAWLNTEIDSLNQRRLEIERFNRQEFATPEQNRFAPERIVARIETLANNFAQINQYDSEEQWEAAAKGNKIYDVYGTLATAKAASQRFASEIVGAAQEYVDVRAEQLVKSGKNPADARLIALREIRERINKVTGGAYSDVEFLQDPYKEKAPGWLAAMAGLPGLYYRQVTSQIKDYNLFDKIMLAPWRGVLWLAGTTIDFGSQPKQFMQKAELMSQVQQGISNYAGKEMDNILNMRYEEGHPLAGQRMLSGDLLTDYTTQIIKADTALSNRYQGVNQYITYTQWDKRVGDLTGQAVLMTASGAAGGAAAGGISSVLQAAGWGRMGITLASMVANGAVFHTTNNLLTGVVTGDIAGQDWSTKGYASSIYTIAGLSGMNELFRFGTAGIANTAKSLIATKAFPQVALGQSMRSLTGFTEFGIELATFTAMGVHAKRSAGIDVNIGEEVLDQLILLGSLKAGHTFSGSVQEAQRASKHNTLETAKNDIIRQIENVRRLNDETSLMKEHGVITQSEYAERTRNIRAQLAKLQANLADIATSEIQLRFEDLQSGKTWEDLPQSMKLVFGNEETFRAWKTTELNDHYSSTVGIGRQALLDNIRKAALANRVNNRDISETRGAYDVQARNDVMNAVGQSADALGGAKPRVVQTPEGVGVEGTGTKPPSLIQPREVAIRVPPASPVRAPDVLRAQNARVPDAAKIAEVESAQKRYNSARETADRLAREQGYKDAEELLRETDFKKAEAIPKEASKAALEARNSRIALLDALDPYLRPIEQRVEETAGRLQNIIKENSPKIAQLEVERLMLQGERERGEITPERRAEIERRIGEIRVEVDSLNARIENVYREMNTLQAEHDRILASPKEALESIAKELAEPARAAQEAQQGIQVAAASANAARRSALSEVVQTTNEVRRSAEMPGSRVSVDAVIRDATTVKSAADTYGQVQSPGLKMEDLPQRARTAVEQLPPGAKDALEKASGLREVVPKPEVPRPPAVEAPKPMSGAERAAEVAKLLKGAKSEDIRSSVDKAVRTVDEAKGLHQVDAKMLGEELQRLGRKVDQKKLDALVKDINDFLRISSEAGQRAGKPPRLDQAQADIAALLTDGTIIQAKTGFGKTAVFTPLKVMWDVMYGKGKHVNIQTDSNKRQTVTNSLADYFNRANVEAVKTGDIHELRLTDKDGRTRDLTDADLQAVRKAKVVTTDVSTLQSLMLTLLNPESPRAQKRIARDMLKELDKSSNLFDEIHRIADFNDMIITVRQQKLSEAAPNKASAAMDVLKALNEMGFKAGNEFGARNTELIERMMKTNGEKASELRKDAETLRRAGKEAEARQVEQAAAQLELNKDRLFNEFKETALQ